MPSVLNENSFTLFIPKEMVPPLLEGAKELKRCLPTLSDENLDLLLVLSCDFDLKSDLIDGEKDPFR